MTAFEWTEELSVGIPEIDRQHRRLMEIIEELGKAMKERRGQEEAARVVGKLVAYVRNHFELEERLFREHGYPESQEHMRRHLEFTRRAHGFRQQAEAGTLLLSVEIMRFLRDWWMTHITVEDQKYAPFLRERVGGRS